MPKVKERGPIDPPPPLCLRVTFLGLCLLGLTSDLYLNIGADGDNKYGAGQDALVVLVRLPFWPAYRDELFCTFT